MEYLIVLLKLVIFVLGVFYLWKHYKSPDTMGLRLDAGREYIAGLNEALKAETTSERLILWIEADREYHRRTTLALMYGLEKLEYLLWGGILLIIVNVV